MATYLGMRGTGDWATDQRPKNWREMILYLYPNGSAPLTAILSKTGSRSVDDPEFNWWTKKLSEQGAAITADSVFSTSDVTTATGTEVTGTSVAGDTVYAKMAAASVAEFRIGQTVVFRDSSDMTVEVTGRITGRNVNADHSYIAVKLLENDDNSSNGLHTADKVVVIGSANPEGGDTPQAVSYDPVKFTNYIQNHREPLEMTDEATIQRLRTGDPFDEEKRETLELHSIGIENSLIFGEQSETTDGSGRLIRTSRGITKAILAHASGNISDYTTATSGTTWIAGGEAWLDEQLQDIFTFGEMEKVGFCGIAAARGIMRLAKSFGSIQLTPTSAAYGVKVLEWVTSFGTLNLKIHPLFNKATSGLKNSIIIVEPNKLKYVYLKGRDTKYLTNRQDPGIDGRIDEYMTKCSLEYHHPDAFGFLNGVGNDS